LLLHCFKLGQVLRALRFQTLSYAWDPKNPLTGEQASINDLSVHVG
jgi:hypothetical protein